MTEITDPLSRKIGMDRDGEGRLIARRLPANGRIRHFTEHFVWRGDGRLKSAHGFGGKVEFGYDPAGRLISETQTQTCGDGSQWEWTCRHAHDEIGVRRASAYGHLDSIQWLTYGAGHLHGVKLPSLSIDLERDELHREIERLIRTSGHPLLFYTETDYDRQGGIAEQRLILDLDRRLPDSRRYTYDALHRLVDIGGLEHIQYQYDPAGRLAGSVHDGLAHRYGFDPAGNRIDPDLKRSVPSREEWAAEIRRRLHDPDFNVLAHIDPPDETDATPKWFDNRITSLDGIENTYDGAGNLIHRRYPDGTELQLSYDGAFRLSVLRKTTRTAAR